MFSKCESHPAALQKRGVGSASVKADVSADELLDKCRCGCHIMLFTQRQCWMLRVPVEGLGQGCWLGCKAGHCGHSSHRVWDYSKVLCKMPCCRKEGGWCWWLYQATTAAGLCVSSSAGPPAHSSFGVMMRTLSFFPSLV